MKGLSSVSEIIPKVIRTIGLKKKAEQVQVLLDWREIVSSPISENTRPVEVKRGVLKVIVETSVWMNELQMMKPELMEKIENKFGKNKIRDIRFCLGKLKQGERKE